MSHKKTNASAVHLRNLQRHVSRLRDWSTRTRSERAKGKSRKKKRS